MQTSMYFPNHWTPAQTTADTERHQTGVKEVLADQRGLPKPLDARAKTADTERHQIWVKEVLADQRGLPKPLDARANHSRHRTSSDRGKRGGWWFAATSKPLDARAKTADTERH